MVFEVEKSRLERVKIVGRHLNACRTDSLSEMAFAMELDVEEETGMHPSRGGMHPIPGHFPSPAPGRALILKCACVTPKRFFSRADAHFGLWDCELGQMQQSRSGAIEDLENKKDPSRSRVSNSPTFSSLRVVFVFFFSRVGLGLKNACCIPLRAAPRCIARVRFADDPRVLLQHGFVAKSCLKNPLNRGRDNSIHRKSMGVLQMMGSHINSMPSECTASFGDASDTSG
jgi:hypothetical protein